jgi:hypothetical protein
MTFQTLIFIVNAYVKSLRGYANSVSVKLRFDTLPKVDCFLIVGQNVGLYFINMRLEVANFETYLLTELGPP